AERHKKGEKDIEMQWPVIIVWIVRVIPVLSHLIAKPAVNTFVEMRRFDVQQGQSGNCCKQQNQRWNHELTANHSKVDWTMHECLWNPILAGKEVSTRINWKINGDLMRWEEEREEAFQTGARLSLFFAFPGK